MKEVTHVDWIRGITLERVTVVNKSEGRHECIVRTLKNTELVGQCDACARRHAPTQLRCAMTRREPSPLVEPVHYVFGTQTIVPGIWELDGGQETFNSSLSREVWVQRAPTAATRSGALLLGL